MAANPLLMHELKPVESPGLNLVGWMGKEKCDHIAIGILAIENEILTFAEKMELENIKFY